MCIFLKIMKIFSCEHLSIFLCAGLKPCYNFKVRLLVHLFISIICYCVYICVHFVCMCTYCVHVCVHLCRWCMCAMIWMSRSEVNFLTLVLSFRLCMGPRNWTYKAAEQALLPTELYWKPLGTCNILQLLSPDLNLLFVLVFCFFVFEIYSLKLACRAGWPWTHRDLTTYIS